MRSKLLALLTAGVLAASLTACGSDSGDGDKEVLRVGTLTDAPPAIYIKDGAFTGFDNELLRDIAKREGFEVEFVGTEFASLLAGVANGQYDIGSSTISATEARKKTVAFSNGYHAEFTAIVTAKGANLASIEAFKGKRLGVVQGSVQDDFATNKVPGAEVVRFPDYNASFAQLRNGTIDGWIVPAEIGNQYIEENPAVPLEVGYKVETKATPSAFAVAKNNKELLDKLNKGLAAAIADGTVKKLNDEFYPDSPLPAELEPGGPGLPVQNPGA
jgi:polar amino acid transport system substrate-binding protein